MSLPDIGSNSFKYYRNTFSVNSAC